MNVYSPAYNAARMWEIVPDRLAAAMKRAGVNQSQLASSVGVKQPSIGRLLSGETKTTRFLNEIATILRTTPAYLIGEGEDEDEGLGVADRQLVFMGPPIEASPPPGMVMIKEFDLALGLGGAFLDVPVEERTIPFPADWLRNFSDAPPELLHFVRGKGDSMQPTIIDGDICLLDTSRKRIDEQDALWAVVYGGLGMIKRLRSMPDGTVKIMSDNESVPAEIAADGELFILGRCRGVFGKR